MKKIFFASLTFLTIHCFGQSSYYISNTGHDASDGKSEVNAFKTIDKINTLDLHAGDKVLFKCNDVFYGQLNLKNIGSANAKILISSFGTGKKPVISGVKQIKNWQRLNGKNDIWEATCITDTTVTNFFRNGNPLPLGRFPNVNQYNHGYLTVLSHNGKTQITSKEAITKDWKGAQLVFKPSEYLIEKPEIIDQDGNTFTVKNEQFSAYDGWGYFIQNALGTLDTDGEWYFDLNAKKIFLYDSNGDPNQDNLEIAFYSKGITIRNCTNIELKNLEITKSSNQGVFVNKSENVTLSNNTIDYCGDNGLVFQGNCTNAIISGNTIQNCNNNGVVLRDVPGLRFNDNTIKNCGTTPGRGKADNGAYVGFQYFGKIGNSIISGNTIENIGYNALEIRASDVLVTHNIISNFCLIKGDGGGIYTWNGSNDNLRGIKIIKNIVTGDDGDTISTNHLKPHMYGIYLDDCSSNDVVQGNTVTKCAGSGIFLHGTINVLVDSNTCYDNFTQYYAGFGKCSSSGNVISNNNFVCKSKYQRNTLILTNGNNASMGTFKNNKFLSLNNDRVFTIVGDNRSPGKAMSLNQFKNLYSQEKSDVAGDIPALKPGNAMEFKFNSTAKSKVFTLPGNYITADGKTVNKKITLQPFSSVVLIKN